MMKISKKNQFLLYYKIQIYLINKHIFVLKNFVVNNDLSEVLLTSRV